MSKVVIYFDNPSGRVQLERNTEIGSAASSGKWSVIRTFSDTGRSDWILEEGEQFKIMVMPVKKIPKGDAFTIEIVTPEGVPLKLTGSFPLE